MARMRKTTQKTDRGPVVEDSDLSAIISNEIRNSLSYDQSQLSNRRALTLEYVRGIMPDLPGRPNGSQQTSRDISDVISWMLPGIMRTMTASDEMVRYASVKDENPAWAEQATAYTNWSFYTENCGYQVLYDVTWDSLALANGCVRCYYDEEETKKQTLNGQTLEDIAELLQEAQDGSVRLLSQRQGKPRKIEDEDGNEITSPTFDIKIERVISKGKICDEALKPENLLVDNAAVNLETCRFKAYLHDDYTRSDLLKMGFDKSLVDSLSPGPNFARNQVELARRYDLNSNWQSPIKSGDRIDTWECYLEADMDGDGIAESVQVWYAGTVGAGQVLGWDYWEDDCPFTSVPCYPIPHRWDAESVADRTKDIQRVNTVLTRALLDSTYAAVVPQNVSQEGAVLNPDALVNPRFGSTLWIKKGIPVADAVGTRTIEYTGDKAIAAMQYMGDMITKRTGVSRTTMALDPEALNNQTASASNNLRDAGYSQNELVARNQSEYGGWNVHFAKRLKLAVKYLKHALVPVTDQKQLEQPPAPPQQGQPPAPLPKFQQVQPSNWDEAMTCTVKTGLGTGSRDRDLAMLNVVLGNQVSMASQLAATGLPTAKSKALDFLPKILQTAERMAESAGLKTPSDYYPQITDADVQQMKAEAAKMAEQPNGEAQLMQLKMQGETQAQQSAAQIATIRGQAEVASSQADLQIKQLQVQQAQRDAQYKDQISGLELQLQAAKADADNNTKLKSQALTALTSIEVARISAKSDIDSSVVSAFLESLIGVQTHQQNLDLATHQANLAPEPVTNGASN